MKLTEFRKLAYTLYATDENDFVKMAGPISGLKRFVRRLLNKLFSSESKQFQESNSELKDVLRGLYTSFKTLESAIDDYDLPTYKSELDAVRRNVSTLNNLLSKIRSDVSKVENEAKDEIKDRYYLKETDEANTKPAETVQKDQSQPEAQTENYVEPVISPETQKLITELAPQEPPASTEQVASSGSETPEVIDPSKLPRTFPVSTFSGFDFHFAEKEINKLKEKLKEHITGNASNVGMDVVKAIAQGTITNWQRGIDKKKPNDFWGEVGFSLGAPYLKQPINLYCRLRLDIDNKQLHVIGVTTNVPARSPIKKSEMDEIRAIRKFARDLGPNFWTKINAMGQRLGVQPEIFLPIMYIESAGFNPQVSTKGGAAGLIQLLPGMLKGTGFQGGLEEFSKLTGEEQLDYIEKFISGVMKGFNKGKPYTDAVVYYISNFWPDALRYRDYYEKYKGQTGWWPEGSFKDWGSPEAVIVEKAPAFRKSPNFSAEFESRAYTANPFLDADKDGRITYGDLQKRIEQVKALPAYKELEAQLKAAPNYTTVNEMKPETPNPGATTSPEDNGFIRILLDNLNMPEVPANGSFFQKIIEGLEIGASSKTDMIEIFGKNKHVNGEFIRVASLVLSRDYGVIPDIHAFGTHFQVVYPTNKISAETVRLLCSEIAEELRSEVSEDCAFRFYVRKDATATLPPLPLERMLRLARMFRIHLIK